MLSWSGERRSNVILNFLVHQRSEVCPHVVVPSVEKRQQLIQVSTQRSVDSPLHQRQTFLHVIQQSVAAD